MTTPKQPAAKSVGQVPLNLGPSSWGAGMFPGGSPIVPPKCPPGQSLGPSLRCRPTTTTLAQRRRT